MLSAPLAFAGLDETASAIRTGERTAVEVTQACLAQIGAHAAERNVFIRVHGQESLARAERLDADRAHGTIHGPLHGIPFAVKDIIDVAGYANSCGTAHRRNAKPATKHAASVQALLSAGAIVIGQANLHEWACGGTSSNPHFGTVRNVWGDNRMPGGSSGGSAVAVAAGMAFVALGTDTGGSVREPASFTGTSSLKVTAGAVSTEGVFPLSWTLDTVGPMARKVRDLVLPYRAMADTTSALPSPPRRHGRLAGTRLGIDRDYYLEEGRVEPGVYKTFANALEQLREEGVEIVEVSIPALKVAAAAFYAIMLSEASAVHSGPLRSNRESYGADVQGSLAVGDILPAQDYIAALRFRARLWQSYKEAFKEVDFLVSPGTPFVASPIGQSQISYPDGSRDSLLDACIRFTFPSNLAGIPTLCQPCGLTDEGMPVGLQFIGEPQSELALLDIGTMAEETFGWQFVSPLVSPTSPPFET
jgi:aspartyl-tRNA(Asn)/glutamyl-tRNA(Gln) amidotransferase subunit A